MADDPASAGATFGASADVIVKPHLRRRWQDAKPVGVGPRVLVLRFASWVISYIGM